MVADQFARFPNFNWLGPVSTSGDELRALSFRSGTAIILDIDPGMHGMAVLEASDVCENSPPIIVVSALEEHHLGPVVQRHGAMACLGKPLSFTRLGRALDQAMESAVAPRCDLWGHVTNCPCTFRKTSVVQQFAAAN